MCSEGFSFFGGPFSFEIFKSIILGVTMLHWFLFHNNYSVIEDIYDIISLPINCIIV